ncbi:MAG: hypothetical protein ACFFER_16070 [Candidatus Thorarchaeota archaeon]
MYRILRKKVLDAFIERVINFALPCTRLLIVSPWITPLDKQRYPLEWIVAKLKDLEFLGIVTREPTDEHHQRAIEILSTHPQSDVIYNSTLHAKIYLASFGRGERKIALIGSANLSNAGNRNVEIGILFFYVRDGRYIIDGLEDEVQIIRTLPWSKRVKSRVHN